MNALIEEIVLAEPRGFCAGVERAVEVVRNALKAHGRPLYVRHQIVHRRARDRMLGLDRMPLLHIGP